MVYSSRIFFVSSSAIIVFGLAEVPANAAACLDHNHSATASGSRHDARSGARKIWAETVKADDGAKWSFLKNARNAKLACIVKDASIGLNVCTFLATPCHAKRK